MLLFLCKKTPQFKFQIPRFYTKGTGAIILCIEVKKIFLFSPIFFFLKKLLCFPVRNNFPPPSEDKEFFARGGIIRVVKIIFCNLNINFVSIRKKQNYEEKQFLKEDFLQEVEYFLTGRHFFSLVACFFYLFQANSFFSHL